MTAHILEQLDHSGLFGDFPEDAKLQLAAISTAKMCSDGQVLYQNGDSPDALYGVLSGGVKTVAEDANGKYFLYGIVQSGWWFGEISALDGQPRAQTTIAIGETQVLKIPRKALLALLDKNPQLYRHFLNILCKRVRQAGVILEEGAFLPLSKRLAKQLLRIHKSSHQHKTKINQEELAASMGVTRQSIHRVLKDWQVKEWIQVTYGDIKILQPQALQMFVELSES
jgi:CRP/FNR family cyclic AMP-dependent transcriptional regulator